MSSHIIVCVRYNIAYRLYNISLGQWGGVARPRCLWSREEVDQQHSFLRPLLEARWPLGAWGHGQGGFWAGSGRGGFLQGFREDVAVAGGQGDSAERGEGWSDVGRGDGLKVLPGLDAEAHEQNRDVLIIVVRLAVAGAVGTPRSQRSAVHQPVGFWQDE